MSPTAIALRLLGAYRVRREMQDGKPTAWVAGPVVKTARGVYDVVMYARKRPPKE